MLLFCYDCCCEFLLMMRSCRDVLNDDELPLFTGNNGDVGLCLAMDDDFCEHVIVHSYTFAYFVMASIGKLQRRLMPC